MSSSNVLYPSFRNRNYWLEYSTPSTTTFLDYDAAYDSMDSWSTTTPRPGPFFLQPHQVCSPSNFVFFRHLSIHLRAEIAFQAEISGLEFWSVFQAEISGLIFSGQNFRPKFQAEISGRNFRAEVQSRKFHARIS